MKEKQFDAKRESLREVYKIKEGVQDLAKHSWDKLLVAAMRTKHSKVEAARSNPDFISMRVNDLAKTLQICSNHTGVRITIYRGVAVIDHGVRMSVLDLEKMAAESKLDQDVDLVNMMFPVITTPLHRNIHGVIAELIALQARPITSGDETENKLHSDVNKLIDKIVMYVEDKLGYTKEKL